MEEANKNYENLKLFFDMDLKVKQILSELVPNSITEVYMNKLIKQTKLLEYYLNKMVVIAGEPYLASVIKKKFQAIKTSLYELESLVMKSSSVVPPEVQRKIQLFYHQYYADISDSFISDVNEHILGYYLFKSLKDILEEASTVNEMTHALHAYVTRDERKYRSMPVLSFEEMEYGTKTLYGEEQTSLLGKQIYDSIIDDSRFGNTDILAFENDVYVMIRNLAHALTIHITKLPSDQYKVEYYLPKICNLEMVQALKGIEHITPSWATGKFFASNQEFYSLFSQFLANVPTDKDMELKFI